MGILTDSRRVDNPGGQRRFRRLCHSYPHGLPRFRKTDVDYPGLYARVCGRLFSTCRPGRQKPVLNSLFFTKKSEVLLLRRAQRPRLVNGESFHKPAVFLTGKGADFRRVARPLKPAGIQPHIQQHKAGLIMVQRFEPVGFPAAEKIKRVGVRIHLIRVPDDCHKPIDREAHICAAADQIEL